MHRNFDRNHTTIRIVAIILLFSPMFLEKMHRFLVRCGKDPLWVISPFFFGGVWPAVPPSNFVPSSRRPGLHERAQRLALANWGKILCTQKYYRGCHSTSEFQDIAEDDFNLALHSLQSALKYQEVLASLTWPQKHPIQEARAT